MKQAPREIGSPMEYIDSMGQVAFHPSGIIGSTGQAGRAPREIGYKFHRVNIAPPSQLHPDHILSGFASKRFTLAMAMTM